MSTLPWHRWYHGTWLSSETRLSMTAAERGIYRDALDLCYSEGSIPADPVRVQRLLSVTPEEFSAAWPSVSLHFEPDSARIDRLVNPKAAEVMHEAADYRRRQAENGKKGGRPKGSGKRSQRLRKANPFESTKGSLSDRIAQEEEVSSSDEEETSIIAPAGGAKDVACFDPWWTKYPRKRAKTEARRAFENVVLRGRPPQGATVDDFDGLRTSQSRVERLAATSNAWAREFAKRPKDKIPYPATFLNRLDWIGEPDGEAELVTQNSSAYWNGFGEPTE